MPRLLMLLWLLATPLLALPQAEGSGTPLSATVDASADAALQEGLSQRFSKIETLRQVTVDVEAGVVRLGGLVPSPAALSEAEDIARRTEGVVSVGSNIQIELDVRQRVLPVFSKLVELGRNLIAYLPLLLLSLLILWLFARVGRWVARHDRLFKRLAPNPFLRELARQAVRVGIFVAGLLIALEILDATALVGAVLGTAGVLGLALGFAFRDLVENYIASILLSLRQPFAPNDFVEIDGRSGKIVRLTARATILMTADGNHLRIPNAQVFKGVILNYTRNPKRRFDFGVGVGMGEDLVEAQKLGVQMLRDMAGVLDQPEPSAQIGDLGDSNVQVRFYGWVDQKESSFAKVKSEAIRLVKTALEDAGMDLPEPIYRVNLIGPAAPIEVTRQPAKKSDKPRSQNVEVDISADDPVDDQINAERATSNETDLLDANAPQE